MKNPENWPEEVGKIEKVDFSDDYHAITFDGGWTLGISNSELDAFRALRDRDPQPGDEMISYGGFGYTIKGIVIDGVVLRYLTRAQVEAERQEWLANYDREKVETYFKMKDIWQETVEGLHPILKARIRRFEKEKGAYEFWKESGGYELVALSGANAILNAAEFYHPGDTDRQIKFVDDWWHINTAKHNYNYPLQKALIPEFGDDHSGNTAGAALYMARAILTGSYVESV